MYINRLEIISNGLPLQTINFTSGINLIVDETPPSVSDATGNGVGKTTVLKLIDFCFGKGSKEIYRDPDSKKPIVEIKNFLEKNKVLIKLTLSNQYESIDEDSKYVIERNFITTKNKIQRLNGNNISKATDIPRKLGEDLFDIPFDHRPTFRQLVTRIFRIDPPAVDHTLKFLPGMAKDTEYETLFLYMFGAPQLDRSTLLENLKKEKTFSKRIETKNNS